MTPPIHKRWPDRYAIRMTLYRKNGEGKSVQIETDLTDAEYANLNAWIVATLRRGTEEEKKT